MLRRNGAVVFEKPGSYMIFDGGPEHVDVTLGVNVKGLESAFRFSLEQREVDRLYEYLLHLKAPEGKRKGFVPPHDKDSVKSFLEGFRWR